MNDDDTANAMRRNGGAFERALAKAFLWANPNQQTVLKAAFPELWQYYQGVAAQSAQGPTLWRE